MREAIERAGYLFEQRLVPIIERAGYKTTPNYRFENRDCSTSELDIFAISAKEIEISSKGPDWLWITLLIECKNLRCPLVFFTQREMRSPWFLGNPHIVGLPCKIYTKGESHTLAEFFKLEDVHHYYSRAKLTSQFCAVALTKEGEKKQRSRGSSAAASAMTSDDYFAAHTVGPSDLYSDGILKLVRAVNHEKQEYARKVDKEKLAGSFDLQLYYPILITSGPLFECTQVRGRQRPIYRRVHRVGFIHRGRTDCRIDIVDYPQGVRGLLTLIERETDHVAKIIKTQYRTVDASSRKLSGRLAKFSKLKRRRIISGDEWFFG